MRITIDLDDDLVERSREFSGASTAQQAIEAGPRLLIQRHAQNELRELRGDISWTGDPDAMRRDH